jgi:hypothetical protein
MPARLQIEAKLFAKPLNDAFQVFGIGDGFGEA